MYAVVERSSPAEVQILLEPGQRRELLAVARQALSSHLVGGLSPANPHPSDHPLSRLAGAFVTLRSQGRLRGCIGRTDASRPLYDVIATMAVAAGTRDPRFSAVPPDELTDITIEISVLGPLLPCSPDEVELGRDGLVVDCSPQRGLLLPEVPLDFGWDVPEFIARTCQKAGLPSDTLEQGAELYRFETQHFSED